MKGRHGYGLCLAWVGAVFLCGVSFGVGASWAGEEVSGRAVGDNFGNDFVTALRAAKEASATGRWKDAASAWERVSQMNPVNEEYWERLAEADSRSGDFGKAIPAFEKVLALGGYCFPSETAYNIARSHARLGNKEKAIQWLQDAFARGYRDLDHARNDSAFQMLKDDPRWAALVGANDSGSAGNQMSREEGWRRDLALLQKELERKSYPRFVQLSNNELEAEVAKLSGNLSKLSDLQATVEVMRLMAKMGVGHTEALPPHTLEFAETLPLKFFLFQEGLYVIAADPKYEELLGAQVLRFGDSSAEQARSAVDPVVYNDNAMWLKAMGPNLLRYTSLLQALNLISDPMQVTLTIRDLQGHTRAVSVQADPRNPDIWNVYPHPSGWIGFPAGGAGELPLYLKNMGALYWFEYLPESRTVYFQYNRVLDDPKEPFDKFVARLFEFIDGHDVDKLVIDLRWNNGGNTYLVPPLIHAVVANRKIKREGGLFVIVGRRTFSAAGNAATFLQRETNAIFVGEPTGTKPNSLGDEVYMTLPYSKLTASIADVYWESSWPQDFRKWIAPQIYVEPSFAAYGTKHDAALEAILGLRLGGMAISQHPGFGCRSEQQMDIEDKLEEARPGSGSQ